MALLQPNHWPLFFICVAMIVAAVIDGWKRKVPNWLTFPLVFSGWLLGLLHLLDIHPDAGQGTLWDSMAGTALGLVLLLPIYVLGGMGAGDVKMQMGFGAWVGAFYPFSPSGWMIIMMSFAVGVLVGGLIGLIMALVRRQWKRNLNNVRTILASWLAIGKLGLDEVANRGDALRAREPKLPYGIPLCIGFVGYLLWVSSG